MEIKTLEKLLAERLDKFNSRNGTQGKALANGTDWSPSQWLQAVVSEIGEYANERRAYELGLMAESNYQASAGAELADVVMFVIQLAWVQGIDIDQAIFKKFNEVNTRMGLSPLEEP